MNTYQVLRAIQAMLATIGVWLCIHNLVDAVGDYRWLQDHSYNGLRQLTARASMWQCTGRLILQILLVIIGTWGMFVCAEFAEARLPFEKGETMLDTIITVVALVVSWQAWWSRRAIVAWRMENPNDTTSD